MKEFSLRPKNEFLIEAEWQHIYRLTERWKSDLLFLSDEVTFSENLLGKFFLSYSKEESERIIHQILDNLKQIDKKRTELSEKLNTHLKQIEELIEYPNSHDAQIFRREHVRLEEELEILTDEFKSVKSELFKITERVLEDDKYRHLLNK